jgi:hypothetical protein
VPNCSQDPQLQRVAAARVQAAAAGEAKQRRRGGGRRYVAAAAPGCWRRGGVDAVALLRQGAEAADVLEAYCAALLVAWGEQLRGRPAQEAGWPAAALVALSDAEAWLAPPPSRPRPPGPEAGGSYSGFLAALAVAGWDAGRVALLQGPARLAWGADLHTE